MHGGQSIKRELDEAFRFGHIPTRSPPDLSPSSHSCGKLCAPTANSRGTQTAMSTVHAITERIATQARADMLALEDDMMQVTYDMELYTEEQRLEIQRLSDLVVLLEARLASLEAGEGRTSWVWQMLLLFTVVILVIGIVDGGCVAMASQLAVLVDGGQSDWRGVVNGGNQSMSTALLNVSAADEFLPPVTPPPQDTFLDTDSVDRSCRPAQRSDNDGAQEVTAENAKECEREIGEHDVAVDRCAEKENLKVGEEDPPRGDGRRRGCITLALAQRQASLMQKNLLQSALKSAWKGPAVATALLLIDTALFLP